MNPRRAIIFILAVPIAWITYVFIIPIAGSNYELTDSQKNHMRADLICIAISRYWETYGSIPEFDDELANHLTGDNPGHEPFLLAESLPKNTIGEYVAVDGRPFKYSKSGLTISVFSENGKLICTWKISK